MKIPHLVKEGSFRPVIRRGQRQNHNHVPLTIKLGKSGGYAAAVVVNIQISVEKEFEAAIALKDWTRFPARIRAAATELRDHGLFGTHRITQNNGILTIS